MKMSRYKFGRNLCAAQLPAHERGSGVLPNRMFDIHDRTHQGDESEIALDHGEQSADPSAVACPENSELGGTAFTQRRHELANFHDALSQTFGVADQISRNCELAVPVTERNARVMIWQMYKARVPSQFVQTRCPTPIAEVRRGHESVEHEHGRRSPRMRARKKFGARNVVSR